MDLIYVSCAGTCVAKTLHYDHINVFTQSMNDWPSLSRFDQIILDTLVTLSLIRDTQNKGRLG